MFTGIIQETGTIKSIQNDGQTKKLIIESKKLLKNRKIGDSISVNGICSTITKISHDEFEVQYMQETLKTTNVNSFKENQTVNLELPIKAGETFDGHFVQGHIDTTGIVENINSAGETAEITIKFDKKYTNLTALKGSITINGVSLTISKIEMGMLTVSLIPHTLTATDLGNLKKGDTVNLEFDLLAKQIKHLLETKEDEIKYEFLRERNLI